MEERDKLKLVQLNNKIEILRKMQLSDSEIEKSFDKDDLDLIEKARVHKYIRKEGSKYIYEEPKTDKIKLSREIMSAFNFLGIDPEKFSEMKDKFGGIEGLHEEMGKRLSGEKKEDEPQLSEKSKAKVLKVTAYLKKHGLTTTTNEINSAADGSDEILSPKEIEAVRFYFNNEEKCVKPELEKSEESDSKEKKVAKVMREFKEGKLKTSAGETVTDRDQAIAIAMSEAGLSKSEEDGIEKGGEGSRGGKVIGHTRSGKPIYSVPGHESHSGFSSEDHMDASSQHKIILSKLREKKQLLIDKNKHGKKFKKISDKEFTAESRAKMHYNLANKEK